MSATVVTATYLNGDSVIAIPSGFDPNHVWLLVNGQVWAGAALTVSGNTIVAPNIDLSDELVQISQVSGAVVTTTTPDLTAVSSKLDNILAAMTAKPVISTTTNNTLKTSVISTAATLNNVTPNYGMSRQNGHLLTGLAHLEQSITDIILTPIGSRVMRREYGSRLIELIDSNLSASGIAAIFAAVADAIERWEPRFILSRIKVNPENTSHTDGTLGLILAGIYQNQEIELGVTV